MNLHDIERATMLFYAMCSQHPEICPHDYTWKTSITDNEKKMITKTYECLLCGTTKKIEEPIK